MINRKLNKYKRDSQLLCICQHNLAIENINITLSGNKNYYYIQSIQILIYNIQTYQLQTYWSQHGLTAQALDD